MAKNLEAAMKKWLISIFCLISLGLQAAQYRHKISITPLAANEEGKKTYQAKIELTKQLDENSEPLAMDVPKLVCIEGQLTEATNTLADKSDLTVKIFIPENENEAKALLLLQEDNTVVLSSEEAVKIGNVRAIRHWADKREQLMRDNPQ
jgi:hypothetical protein